MLHMQHTIVSGLGQLFSLMLMCMSKWCDYAANKQHSVTHKSTKENAPQKKKGNNASDKCEVSQV